MKDFRDISDEIGQLRDELASGEKKDKIADLSPFKVPDDKEEIETSSIARLIFMLLVVITVPVLMFRLIKLIISTMQVMR